MNSATDCKEGLEEARLKGLSHDDLLVRSAMLAFFAREPRLGPEAARRATAQIDRHGWTDAYDYPHHVVSLPHCHETVQWTADRLARLAANSAEDTLNEQVHLARWFCKSPAEWIALHLESLIERTGFATSAASSPTAISLQQAVERLEFSRLSDDDCLRRLEDVLVRCDQSDKFPHREVRQLDILCEEAASRALLSEDTVAQWLRIESLDSERPLTIDDFRAGAGVLFLRHGARPPSVDSMLRLFELDWDWLEEETVTTLIATRDSSTLGSLLRRYPELDWSPRLFLTSVFQGLRFPEHEAILIETLCNEMDDDLRVKLAYALAHYGSPSAQAPVREVAHEYQKDPERVELLDLLCVQEILLGEETDETRRHHASMQERHRQSRATFAELDAFFAAKAAAEEFDPEPLEPVAVAPALPTPSRKKKVAAYRLATPKEYPGVGRNDPCPCGSGNKFKKCCGP